MVTVLQWSDSFEAPRTRSRKPFQRRAACLRWPVACLIGLAAAFLLFMLSGSPGDKQAGIATRPATPRAAIVVHLASTDPFHLDNYRFLLRHGPCESALGFELEFFVMLAPEVAVNGGADKLPNLPPKWKYWPVATCDRYQAVVELLTTHQHEQRAFDRLLLVDSFVRGPILPVYIRQRVSWVDVFLSSLDAGASLVSSAMVCAPATSLRGAQFINDPHVMALDADGMSALTSAVAAIPCDARKADPLAAAAFVSLFLVIQGFNITSLQHKFADVDWSLAGNRKCDAMQRSDWLGNMDADPMETVFVKVTGKQVMMGWEAAFYAGTASGWLDAQLAADRNVDSNAGWVDRDAIQDAHFCFHSKLYPQRCFDFAGYLQKNPDLTTALHECNVTNICWQHFGQRGALEGRYGEFRCEMHATRNFSTLVLT